MTEIFKYKRVSELDRPARNMERGSVGFVSVSGGCDRYLSDLKRVCVTFSAASSSLAGIAGCSYPSILWCESPERQNISQISPRFRFLNFLI